MLRGPPERVDKRRPRPERVSVFDFADPDDTGATDCSAAIKAAHDAAVALGYRYLWFPPGDYFAPALSGCGNAIFVGPGRLIGAYRKHIIPEHLPARPLCSDVVPGVHLRHFLAAVAEATPERPAVVVGMGDSTTLRGSPIGRADTMTDHIRRRLSEIFPRADETIRYLNYSAGGLGWGHAMIPLDMSVKAAWITKRDVTWLEHVLAAEPDLVVINLGQNGSLWYDCSQIHAVAGKLRAASDARVRDGGRPIDVLFLTPFPPSNMHAPENNVLSGRPRMKGVDFVAGHIRTFCVSHGYGLIDVHRAGCLARDGFDPRGRAMRRIMLDVRGQRVPFSSPVEVNDFELNFTVDPGTGAAFWDQGSLRVKLSAKDGNHLVLDRDPATGMLALTVNAGTDVVALPRRVTTFAPNFKGDGVTFVIYAKGSRLYIERAGFVVLDIAIERHGGSFTPTLSFDGGSAFEGVTIDWLNVDVPTLSMPILTDAEMFGTPEPAGHAIEPIEPGGGNGCNHLSSLGNLHVLGAALDATRFA